MALQVWNSHIIFVENSYVYLLQFLKLLHDELVILVLHDPLLRDLFVNSELFVDLLLCLVHF